MCYHASENWSFDLYGNRFFSSDRAREDERWNALNKAFFCSIRVCSKARKTMHFWWQLLSIYFFPLSYVSELNVPSSGENLKDLFTIYLKLKINMYFVGITKDRAGHSKFGLWAAFEINWLFGPHFDQNWTKTSISKLVWAAKISIWAADCHTWSRNKTMYETKIHWK